MTLKLVKLSTGEELIAEVVEVKGGFTLDEAMQVVLAPKGQQGMAIQYLPWTMAIFSGGKPVYVHTNHVVATADADEDLVSYHRKTFGKIELQEKKIIV